jgi:hypothetical protein
MSEYPYRDRIKTDDIISSKNVFSSDDIIVGQVEAVFADSFIIRSEEEKGAIEVKYEIPRLQIKSIIKDSITLKQTKENIQKQYKKIDQ